MELTVLGRYGPYPRPGGACSGYLLTCGKTRILLDCGPGVLSRLLQKVPLHAVDAIVLSHLHYDHCADLAILRYALEQLGTRDAIRVPMPVYAPQAPEQAYALLDYPVFDAHALHDGLELTIGGVTLAFHTVAHPVPTFGMMLAYGGRRLFYTGDTGDFPGLSALCRGADALLCDACFVDADECGKPLPHLTARQAGRLARRAEVGRLLLTHLWGGADTEEAVKKEVDSPNAIVVQELENYTI